MRSDAADAVAPSIACPRSSTAKAQGRVPSEPAPRLYERLPINGQIHPHLDFIARLHCCCHVQPSPTSSHHYPPHDQTSYARVIQVVDCGPSTQKTSEGTLQYRQNGFERRRRPARRWRCGTGEPGAAHLSHLSWPSNDTQGAHLPLPETRNAVHVESSGYSPAVV